MRINTNVAALNAQRVLGQTDSQAAKLIGRLSSGFRINHASDDAAGLGIANRLRADIRSLKQAARNAEQATSVLQIAEGATQTVSGIIDRMKELATQAASDNVDAAGRTSIKAEWDQLVSEIGAIASTTKFQGKTLIDGNFGNSVDAASSALAAGTGLYEVKLNGTAAGTFTFSQAADGELKVDDGNGNTQTVTGLVAGKQTVTFDQFGLTLNLTEDFDQTTATGSLKTKVVTVNAGSSGGSFLVRSSGAYSTTDLISLDNLNLTTGASGLDVSTLSFTSEGTAAEWQGALTRLDAAIGKVNTALGTIGAAQNRIDFATQNVKSAVENASAAESTIRDADMAEEMSNFTKTQILQQSGIAMLAQANAAPQMVLKLLG